MWKRVTGTPASKPVYGEQSKLLEQHPAPEPAERASMYSRKSAAARTDEVAVPEVLETAGSYVRVEKVDGPTLWNLSQEIEPSRFRELGESIKSVHENGTALMDPNFRNFMFDGFTSGYGGEADWYFVDPEFVVEEPSRDHLDYDISDFMGRLAAVRSEGRHEAVRTFSEGYGLCIEEAVGHLEDAHERISRADGDGEVLRRIESVLEAHQT